MPTPGRGTTATIILSSHPSPTGQPVNRPEPNPAASGVSPRHILVVDDDPLIGRLLKATLELDGHKVTVARDGPEALRIFVQGEHEAVITDRVMPAMNGDELCRALKRISPYLPVIMSSGIPEDPEEAGLQGIAAFMPKPVSRARLQDAIACCFPAAPGPAVSFSAGCGSSPAA